MFFYASSDFQLLVRLLPLEWQHEDILQFPPLACAQPVKPHYEPEIPSLPWKGKRCFETVQVYTTIEDMRTS